MKRNFTKLTLIFLMILAGHQLMAANYYFSQESGNDSRSNLLAQNPATPWKSIDKLNSVFNTLKPGDAVFFKRGEIFFGTIHINKSGAAGNPIKIGAYGSGAKPIITSLVTLNNWKSIGGGRYESVNSLNVSEVNILLVNNKMQELGRYPNSDAPNEGYLTIETVSGQNRISGKGFSGSPNWNGGEVVIKKNQWIIDTQKITSHSGTSVNFSTGSSYPPKVGYGFFIKNHLQTLDKFGEWYYNTSNKKMNVFLGNANPSSYKIEASTMDYLLTKTYGASHLQIENLQFKGANIDAVHITGGTNIKFDQVEIENSGENGLVSLSVLELVIQNCKVKDSHNNGLNLRYGNKGAIIQNNLIENSANMPGTNQNSDGNGIGIFAIEENSLIENNVVRNSGYSGIYFGGNNSIVKNNLIDTFCMNKGDGGGIYSFDGSSTSQFKNRKITDNIVVNAVGSWGGIPQESINFKPLADGIFLDDNSSGIEITGNTVGHAANSGIKMSNVSNIIVKNNTFFDAGSLLTIGNNTLGRDVRNVTVQDNIFFSKHTDQNAYNIQSYKNDIGLMANLNFNYFFRPLGDEYSIYSRCEVSGKMVERIQNREKWTGTFGKDKDSKNNNVDIEKFNVKRQIGTNIFDNGKFNSNTKGIIMSDGGEASWSSNKINGGTLQVFTPKTSSTVINVGSVKKNKKYLLRFKSLSNKKAAIRAYLRYSDTPWEIISPSTSFILNTNISEYQTILSPYEDVENAVLRLVTDDPSFTYWIDDLEFVEVEVEMTNPDEQILFEYNASKSPKTIGLDGIYVDAKNIKYSGSATIAPFQSLVLVKISQGDIKEEEKPLATIPAKDGYYFNTTSDDEVPFGNEMFVGMGANYLVTPKTNVGSNTQASQDALFQKERFAASLSFEIPVPNGIYTVRTYHNETYYGVGGRAERAGQRVFDILLNGITVKKDLDLFVENGNNQTILQFGDIEVKNGVLNLGLIASANNATISGLAIIGQSGISETVKEVITTPTGTAYYFNTTSNDEVPFGNEMFVGMGANYLVTPKTNVGSNTQASQDALFQKERFAASLSFEIPVPNGIYTVRTYHNETYYGVGGRAERAGQRVFDILLNGKTVKKDLDMFVENGNNQTILQFEDIEVKNGVLNLGLIASANNATISGLAIIGQSGIIETVKEVISTPTGTAYYFNTTSNDEVPFGNEMFVGMGANYLLTPKTNVGSNTKASNDVLFQKERFAKTLSFDIPVPDGIYTVKTYHNETYYGVGGRAERAGQRVFDILLNGKTVKKDLDLFVENGNKQTILQFVNIEVKNGVLKLDLIASANNATISGLAIIGQKGLIETGALRLDSETEGMETVEEIEKAAETVEVASVEKISLYPNPARDQTTLVVSVEISSILIHDMNGQLIRNFDPQMLRSERGKYSIPLSNVSQGLYVVSLVGEKGMIEQLRLIVNP